MKRLFHRIKDGEDRGAALALVAASLVVLMGMAAFGTDLGWFYLNASRVQRAADAAALGGVIWMPAGPSRLRHRGRYRPAQRIRRRPHRRRGHSGRHTRRAK